MGSSFNCMLAYLNWNCHFVKMIESIEGVPFFELYESSSIEKLDFRIWLLARGVPSANVHFPIVTVIICGFRDII